MGAHGSCPSSVCCADSFPQRGKPSEDARIRGQIKNEKVNDMAEKILVVGGGGREHAIIKALKKSPDCGEIWCAPGNGGISYDAKCKNIKATDVDTMVGFAVEEKFDYVVVAQDDPLALGMVDALAKAGIPAFGPDKAAARIEASKVFSKDLSLIHI